jgi:AcrR family transcriptional regulator
VDAVAEGSPHVSSRAAQRQRSEARILAVACRMFTEVGYDRTSFRAIAAEAGVDPRLVLHYFGSKAELFRRVAAVNAGPPDPPGRSDSSGPPRVEAEETAGASASASASASAPASGPVPVAGPQPGPERVPELLLDALIGKLRGEQPGGLAMIRSMLTHPEAAESVRRSIRAQQDELGRALSADDGALRIGLIGALMLGVTIGRDLLELDGLREASAEEIVARLRPCIHALAQAPPEPDPRTRPAGSTGAA